MDYKIFYLTIRRYANGKISWGMFIVEWRYEQRRQGIGNPKWTRGKNGGKIR